MYSLSLTRNGVKNIGFLGNFLKKKEPTEDDFLC